MSQFFASGGQSIGVSASASILPVNIQDWFPLGGTGWISLLSKGLLRVSSNTTVQKHQFLLTLLSLWSNSHPYMTTGDLHLNSFSGASSHTCCYSGLFSPRFLFSVSFGIWKLIPSFYDSLVILCLYHSCLPGSTKHESLDYAFSKIIFGYTGSSLLWGLSLVATSKGCSSLWCVGFSLWWFLLRSTGSRVWAQLLWHVGAIAVAHRLSCPMARGIFLDQGLNPDRLH